MFDAGDVDRVRRQRLYNNETFSDITVCYDGLRVLAHKSVLSISSDYFLRAFTGDFKEATSTELHLLEDDVEAVTGMLRFIYGFDPSIPDGSACFQIQLMVIADKYDVPSLYASAKARLAQRLESLELPCADFYPSLLADIYAAPACDGETRRCAIAVCQRDLEGWLQQEDFRELMLERSEISMDVLSAAACKATADKEGLELASRMVEDQVKSNFQRFGPGGMHGFARRW